MKNSKKKIRTKAKIILYFLVIIFAFYPLSGGLTFNSALAETNNSSPAKLAMTQEEEKTFLENKLKELGKKIAQYEKDITKTQQEKNTLLNQTSILRNKIKRLALQIQQSNVMIKDLGLQVKDTEISIDKTSLKIEDSKQKLVNVLRTLNEEDQKSLLEILLSEPKLSNFFDNLVALESLSQKNHELLKNIRGLKSNLETQKQTLGDEKEDLGRITKIKTLQRTESLQVQKEKEKLLEQTKGKESEYQRMLQATQKEAAEIRARIFELVGVVETPTFGQALEIAKYVENITGVRPAFLLAVLTQESNIGKNVGQCYLRNVTTGAGIYIRTGRNLSRVMSPTRDVPPFLQITKELGRDSFNTPVSCPMSYGWGGAMGPAQFIPSTWMLYRNRLASIKGSSADPWNIRDAFLASGLYLSDGGAASKTYNKEWCAAISYFSGNCSYKNQVRYGFYANSVMAIATGYEQDIKAIEKSLAFFIE